MGHYLWVFPSLQLEQHVEGLYGLNLLPCPQPDSGHKHQRMKLSSGLPLSGHVQFTREATGEEPASMPP